MFCWEAQHSLHRCVLLRIPSWTRQQVFGECQGCYAVLWGRRLSLLLEGWYSWFGCIYRWSPIESQHQCDRRVEGWSVFCPCSAQPDSESRFDTVVLKRQTKSCWFLWQVDPIEGVPQQGATWPQPGATWPYECSIWAGVGTHEGCSPRGRGQDELDSFYWSYACVGQVTWRWRDVKLWSTTCLFDVESSCREPHESCCFVRGVPEVDWQLVLWSSGFRGQVGFIWAWSDFHVCRYHWPLGGLLARVPHKNRLSCGKDEGPGIIANHERFAGGSQSSWQTEELVEVVVGKKERLGPFCGDLFDAWLGQGSTCSIWSKRGSCDDLRAVWTFEDRDGWERNVPCSSCVCSIWRPL